MIPYVSIDSVRRTSRLWLANNTTPSSHIPFEYAIIDISRVSDKFNNDAMYLYVIIAGLHIQLEKSHLILRSNIPFTINSLGHIGYPHPYQTKMHWLLHVLPLQLISPLDDK